MMVCAERIFRRMFALCALLPLLGAAPLFAQISIRAGFLADSIKIGEETAFYLAAQYPDKETILFPDSTHAFAPFEYVRKEYFATKTTDGVSRDSAIYYLKTFEVDPTLFLQLPAYQVTPGDCTVFQSGADSLRIIQMVGEVPDSISIEKLPLKMNVAYHPVGYELNYFILSLVGAGLILVAAVVWIFFGRKISRFFKTRSLTARHRKFIESFERTVNELQGKFSPVATESAVSLWKKYLETLESRPYTKMTSRETVRFLNDKKLAEKFYFIDRAIYGGEGMVIEPLQHLKVVADERFTKKIDELKHAK